MRVNHQIIFSQHNTSAFLLCTQVKKVREDAEEILQENVLWQYRWLPNAHVSSWRLIEFPKSPVDYCNRKWAVLGKSLREEKTGTKRGENGAEQEAEMFEKGIWQH